MTTGGHTPDASDQDGAAPAKSRFIRYLLLAALGLPLLAALLAAGIFLYGKYRFEARGPHDESVIVMLSPGMGVRAIATRLDREGVISDPYIFLAGVRFHRAERDLKAGEYAIPAHASMAAIMGILREGRSILHRLTIPEGLTSEQVMLLVAANPVLVGDL
ncbi:MAG: endolytic transglycosylase MltG, partial [Parvibaculum sp.]|nr:endolytic transglycosylase MltG [Parvibaculum sp.]